jgi:hypothetical protein
LSASLSRNVSRSQIKIAVLDTWPMGDGSVGPLGLIAEFRDRLRSSRVDTARLAEVAEGRIVPQSRIHDYIAASPLRVP